VPAWTRPAPAQASGDERAADAPAGEETDFASSLALGRDLHGQFCAACHQADGRGLPAAGFPALAGTTVALDEHKKVTVHGRRGTAMAAFGPQLRDEQLAAIVTYQRNAWGNDTGDFVKPADIAAAR
jgi:cytochrome c oxidase subunit II